MRNALSKKIIDIQPSGIRKFFDVVNEIPDAISLGVGEPDFDTPWNVREEGIYALEKGRTFYTSNAGLKELREEIDKRESNENTNTLLGDLMATNVNEEVLKPIATKIENSKIEDDSKKIDKVKEKTIALKDEIDKSFYTKSLDLSEEDFENDDEIETKPSKLLSFLKFILSLALILAVGFGVYYVITNF